MLMATSTETALAIYGAVLATVLAGLQVGQWVVSRRRRVRVEMVVGSSPDTVFSTLHGRDPICIYAEVINETDRDEQIAWIFLERLYEDGEWNEDAGVGENRSLPARNRWTCVMVEEGVDLEREGASFNFKANEKPVRIHVLLGTGRHIYSDPSPVPDWLANDFVE